MNNSKRLRQIIVVNCGRKGYTLLETVVALGILVAVVVPVAGRFTRSMFTGDAHRELTASWLCSQEAEVIGIFPDMAVPLKQRYIDGVEWTVRMKTNGKKPAGYTLTATLRNREYGRLFFYGRRKSER